MSVCFRQLFHVTAGIAALSCVHLAGNESAAQQSPPAPSPAQANGTGLSALIRVPVTSLFPGGTSLRPKINVPLGQDPQAPQRGMEYFDTMNCVGCHAPNGGGGMGPSLSNGAFTYGSAPENIFLSIFQGRPNGMPAWGEVLPEQAIWDLVAYIQNLSKDPDTGWGTTISRSPQSPKIEQVPAELVTTDAPWSKTQPFRSGRKP
jgi:cytochrome c oxidase cbb3-type subunit III